MVRRADGNFEPKKLDPTVGVPRTSEVKGPANTSETAKTSPKNDRISDAVRQFAGDFFTKRVNSGKTNPRVADLALEKLSKGDINYKGSEGDATSLGNV